MEHIGIDVHKVESQLCILTESGEIVERRIRTQRERFVVVLGARPRAKVLIEASTESEWVARCLEELGHEVVVADPNFAAMYATRSRRVKTDRRDARTLAEACRLGAFRPAHRTSDAQRHVRTQLSVREALVQTRTRFISLIGATLWREGFRVASGSADGFLRRIEKLPLPGHLKSEIAPLLAVVVSVNGQLTWADQRIEDLARKDETVARLCTAPSVGR
jgi:transposase